MASRKRPPTFFEAETRVIDLDQHLMALSEETRIELDIDSADQLERARIAGAETLLAISRDDLDHHEDLAAGSEHGTTRLRIDARDLSSFSEIMTAQRPVLDREPPETSHFERLAVGSNPPAPRVSQDEFETTFRREVYPRFEAAQGAAERTELRPTTMPAGPYCAVAAPQLAAYQVTKQLASGGMGIVYEAFHRESGERVAVKYMRETSAQKASLVKRFLGEGIAASRIDHPGVTDIYDYGHDKDGVPYLVMEYLEGENLGDRLTRGPLSAGEFIDISRQLVDTLSAAHRHGIVHRDLKPDNIFLVAGPTKRVKLLDFGVAKFLNDQHLVAATSDGQVLGTPYYMSPEQCAGSEIDERSDIYSLGCVFYQMLAGKVPFPGNIFDVVLGHRQHQPLPLRSLRTDLPISVARLIESMMEKTSDQRLPTMQAVSSAIEAIVSGKTQPIPAKPAKRSMRFRRKSRGNARLLETRHQLAALHRRKSRRTFPLALATLALTAATIITALAVI